MGDSTGAIGAAAGVRELALVVLLLVKAVTQVCYMIHIDAGVDLGALANRCRTVYDEVCDE